MVWYQLQFREEIFEIEAIVEQEHFHLGLLGWEIIQGKGVEVASEADKSRRSPYLWIKPETPTTFSP